jgi:hypothetical protein
MRGWKVSVDITKAYVFTVVGEIEDEPSEAKLKEADVISALTPDQLVGLARLKAQKLRAPTVSKRFRCVPIDH